MKLMRTLNSQKHRELGYEWGGAKGQRYTSWLQYADDAAIVSSSEKGSQALLNLFVAWCHWSGMVLRLDKCSSFGMAKRNNAFKQTLPCLFVDGKQVPSVAIGIYLRLLREIMLTYRNMLQFSKK